MKRRINPLAAAWGIILCISVASSANLLGQATQDLASAPGDALYQAACANCHGGDGLGVDPALLAFEEALPDFTDCDFAAREPDADWIAVAHEGGPIRGFSEMMPAFRGALTVEQLERVMGYIRTLCTDTAWPRGELNLPRPLFTEKAYPEDEWVVEADVRLEGESDLGGAFVYEKRFGPRSQWEVVVPYRRRVGTPMDPGGTGLGDVTLGIKHAVFHSLESGLILSFGGELILPSGDESKGLGDPGATVEVFSSAGKILAGDAFLQVQAGVEAPLYEEGENHLFGRLAVGRSFSQGPWGRSWTPMVEVVAKGDLEGERGTQADIVPQLQVALNTRQHVLANAGVLVPAAGAGERPVRFVAYVLLDWFDGGFLEGW